MKEIVKAIFLLAVIYLLLFFLVNTNRQSQVIQEKPETVYLTDTIVNVEWDTVYLERYKTVKLPNTDTTVYYITDTLTRVDSIEVEIPISSYLIDTTFVTDSTRLKLSIRNSGYEVTLDTISYKFEYTPTKTKKTHWFIGPSLGMGYDFINKKLVPTIGIGIGIKRF